MNQDEAKKFLASLTNKQLVEFLSDSLKTRRSDEGTEADYFQAHWCVAEASRIKTDDDEGWENWEVELLAPHDAE